MDENISENNGAQEDDARAVLKQAKLAIDHDRYHEAKALLQKALKLEPGNRVAKDLISTMPELPAGLRPTEYTQYDQRTGLPLEVICETTGGTMVLVPKGKFRMGLDEKAPDADERPAHDVHLNTFYIDKFEVTNKMFALFLENQRVKEGKEAGMIFSQCEHGVVRRSDRWIPAPRFQKYPMVCVTWRGAQMYAKWAGLALPTEAQWEKAARGADARLYPWGQEFSTEKCNCEESRIMHTTPVDKYPGGASPCGCWDMSGNVWEWCFDWYSPDYYSSSPQSEPLGPVNGRMKVLRSSAWGAGAPSARCSARYHAPPEMHIDKLGGFRCVKLLVPRPPREEYKRGLIKKITTALRKPIISGRKKKV